MNLSQAASEALTRGFMLVEERGGDNLCAEDLLYGLLSLSNDRMKLEEPVKSEAKKLYALLIDEFGNPAGAMDELKKRAMQYNVQFTPSDAIFGRAIEIAGEEDVTAVMLCKAALEISTPILDAMRASPDSDETVPEQKENPILSVSGTILEPFSSESESFQNIKISDDAERERKEREEREKKEQEKREQEKREQEKKEREKKEKEAREKREREEKQKREREERERKEKEERERLARLEREKAEQEKKTRRGRVKKNILLFLLTLFAPPLALGAVASFTSIFENLTDTGVALVGTLCLVWAFFVVRRFNKFFWLKNVQFGFFLDLIEDAFAAFMLAGVVAEVFFGGVVPVWLKLALLLVTELIFILGEKLMEELPEDEDLMIVADTRRGLAVGTASNLIFKRALRLLAAVCAVVLIPWAFNWTLPNWLEKTACILGYAVAWYFIFDVYDILGKRAELPKLANKRGRGVVNFLESAHILMTIPEFVLFLHMLFDWRLRTWVLVLMGISAISALIGSVIYAKNK